MGLGGDESMCEMMSIQVGFFCGNEADDRAKPSVVPQGSWHWGFGVKGVRRSHTCVTGRRLKLVFRWILEHEIIGGIVIY